MAACKEVAVYDDMAAREQVEAREAAGGQHRQQLVEAREGVASRWAAPAAAGKIAL